MYVGSGDHSEGAAELKKKSGLVYAMQSNGPHPQV